MTSLDYVTTGVASYREVADQLDELLAALWTLDHECENQPTQGELTPVRPETLLRLLIAYRKLTR